MSVNPRISLANLDTNQTLSYTYDAFGRRVSKTQDGVTQKYLYDGDDIVAILDSNNQVIATITHDESIDIPLSITNTNGTFYYHRDHQGSIVALTDSSGQVVESFTYDNHYGTIVNHTKTIETNNPYAYTGRELDTEELYYYRARYYDPTIQRFVSEDPIGFSSGDFNFYRYVGNKPINFIDPSGMDCISTCLLNYPYSWIYLGALSPLVNLKTPAEYASARRRSPKASPWTSVDRRLGLKPTGGATTRGKPIGKGGSIAVGMGAFATGYFLGALANCSLKCNNFCSTLE